MRLLYLIILALFTTIGYAPALSSQPSKDAIIYKIVIDSLVVNCSRINKTRPFILVSRMWKSTSEVEEIINSGVDNNSFLMSVPKEQVRAINNDSIRLFLRNMKGFQLAQTELLTVSTSVRLIIKNNARNIFRSQSVFRRFQRRNPDFACVASVSKPAYYGSYAFVITDYQFGMLGGGCHIQILRRTNNQWSTIGMVNLWSY